MREVLEALKQVLKKDIKKLVDKGDVTPAEVETLTKALCLYDMVEERLMLENGYAGFSNDYSQRYYRDGGSYEGMPDPYSYDGNSYRRGRSQTTGRYMSRDYNGGRSGHSINDRMIAKLEEMVDQAPNDYERQQILRQIEKMRNGEM